MGTEPYDSVLSRGFTGTGAPPGGTDPDVSLLRQINGVADGTPHWLDRAVAIAGEYGFLALLAVLLGCCWWRLRRGAGPRGREKSVAAVAALLWAPLAAGLALLANIPVREFVERRRPFAEHHDLTLLLSGKGGYSFVSDHATVAMAIAVALFIADRRFGLAALAVALLEGLSRVYLGVHYPTDVVGGFALGTAVALLLAPLAIGWLSGLVRRVGWLAPASAVAPARSGPRPAGPDPVHEAA